MLKKIATVINEYGLNARAELDARWKAWKPDLSCQEVHETVGGLLARQVSMARELVQCPMMWNNHMAPVLLRSMVDTHITLAWICKDPSARSKKYIEYGLGQTKLEIEHRKAASEGRPPSPGERAIIESLEAWLNSQRFTFLTDVNIGSWSDLSTRKMAEEADRLDFYHYCYQPFSAATHSMWNHVGRFNLVNCRSPLHRYHRVPLDPDLGMDPFYATLASKYLRKSLVLFDQAFNIAVNVKDSDEVLRARFRAIFSKGRRGAPKKGAAEGLTAR